MLTESQLKERKKGIGGSDAAAVCGMSKWKTPVDIYIEKTSDEIFHTEENQYMYWGNALEPVIVKKYEEETNKVVCTKNSLSSSKEHPFMLANIDGFIAFDGGILECKTADSRSSSKWGDVGSDIIPEEYLIQCAHYAIVYDAPYVDLAVLIGGNDFRIYTYKRNDGLEKAIIKKEHDFWNNNVLLGIPPEARTESDINKLITKTKGIMKPATQAIKTLISEVKEIKEKIKELEEKELNILFSVKSSIEDYDGLVDEFGESLCTWKIQQSNRFDTTFFKKLHPDIYSQFTKPSTSRVFRLRRD